MCKKNSVFQLLYHLPPIRDHVLNQTNHGLVTTALRTVFTSMESSDTSLYPLLSPFLLPPSSTIIKFNEWFTPKQGVSNILFFCCELTVLQPDCIVT